MTEASAAGAPGAGDNLASSPLGADLAHASHDAIDNHTFLRAVRGGVERGQGLWVLASREPPGSESEQWAGRAYHPSLKFDPDANTYFSVAVLSRPARRKHNFVRMLVLVADDPETIPEGASYVLRTSRHKRQVGFILTDDRESRDPTRCAAALKAMAERGLVPLDRSGNNIVRYVRLPVGTNNKREHGEPFAHVLEQWHPKRRYSLSEALRRFGIDLNAPAALAAPTAVAESNAGTALPIVAEQTRADDSADEPTLIRRLVAGESLHDPLLRLAAAWLRRDMPPDLVKEQLRSLMQASAAREAEPDRWKARLREIDRLVDEARAKGIRSSVASVDEFEVLAEAPGVWPEVSRTKGGGIRPTVGNLLRMLRSEHALGWRLGRDRFTDDVMIAQAGTEDWRKLGDDDLVPIRARLEAIGFTSAPDTTVRQVVARVAEENAFDSAQIWLIAQVPAWDGTPRVERFLTCYFGAADDAYSAAVSLYMWTALAGRVLEPGVQADMVPTLIGAQGVGKSTGVAALAPAPEFFAEISLHENDDDLARLMRGKLVVELPELTGLGKREREAVKAFVTRRHETWVPKYREFSVSYPRRALLIGTSNPTDFLDDSTGNRRWLPLEVGDVDRGALERDRLQLWAEARERFLDGGVQWSEAERLARDRHADYSIDDPWSEQVVGWIKHRDEPTFTTADALAGIGIATQHMDKPSRNRMGALLRGLGCRTTTRSLAGGKARVWRRPEDLERLEREGTDETSSEDFA